MAKGKTKPKKSKADISTETSVAESAEPSAVSKPPPPTPKQREGRRGFGLVLFLLLLLAGGATGLAGYVYLEAEKAQKTNTDTLNQVIGRLATLETASPETLSRQEMTQHVEKLNSDITRLANQIATLANQLTAKDDLSDSKQAEYLAQIKTLQDEILALKNRITSVEEPEENFAPIAPIPPAIKNEEPITLENVQANYSTAPSIAPKEEESLSLEDAQADYPIPPVAPTEIQEEEPISPVVVENTQPEIAPLPSTSPAPTAEPLTGGWLSLFGDALKIIPLNKDNQ